MHAHTYSGCFHSVKGVTLVLLIASAYSPPFRFSSFVARWCLKLQPSFAHHGLWLQLLVPFAEDGQCVKVSIQPASVAIHLLFYVLLRHTLVVCVLLWQPWLVAAQTGQNPQQATPF